MERSIKKEFIVKHIVVVTNGCDAAYNERNVLGNANVSRGSVTLDGVPSVELKQTNAAWVSVSRLINEEGGVQVGGVSWTVIAADELE